MRVDVIVLAGGNLGKITQTKVKSRGLLEVKGKPMLEYEIKALKNSSFVGKITIVVPSTADNAVWKNEVDKVEVSNKSLAQNILVGLESLETGGTVLVASSDIPLITGEIVDGFLMECKTKEAEVYYPIIQRDLIEERFPGCRRTYVKLKEGMFTGGNLILADSDVIKKNADLIKGVYEARKSPFRLARILGLKFIVKFLMRRLSLGELERKVSGLIGAKAVAIVTRHPEIGVDVDSDSDLELVQKVLK